MLPEKVCEESLQHLVTFAVHMLNFISMQHIQIIDITHV